MIASTLIVDAAPLLATSTSTLKGLAATYVTVPDVISEIRDKTSRDLLKEVEWLGLNGEKEGLAVRLPSSQAVAIGKIYIRYQLPLLYLL